MSYEALVTIDGDYYANGSCQLDDLTKAASALRESSESQFDSLKAERWFTRVFDMATFSQKKNIRMATQIQHLAQAQHIFAEILVVLSQRDKRVFDLLRQCQAMVETLANQDLALARRINALEQRVLLGLDDLPVLEQWPDTQKQTLADLLLQLSLDQGDSTEYQKDYANGLLTLLNVKSTRGGYNLVAAIEQISTIEDRRLMLECCLEYLYLNSNTFKYDEKVRVLLDAFDLGTKTFTKIQEQILAVHKLRGNSGLSGKFGVSPVAPQEESFSISLDEVDEAILEEGTAVREDVVISRVLHIPVGESLVFTNKNVVIRNFVNCEGALTFENCSIQYNVDDQSGSILLSEGSALHFIGGQVECKRIDDKSYFVQDKGSNSSVTCKEMLFDNCSHLIAMYGEKSAVHINNCFIKDPGRHFIYTQYGDANIRLENCIWETTHFAPEQDVILKHRRPAIKAGKSFEAMSCIFRGIESIANEKPCKEQRTSTNPLIEVKNGKFKSCTFTRLKGLIKYPRSIIECSFEECEDIFPADSLDLSDMRNSTAEITNCIFSRCMNVVSSRNMAIKNTQFFECGGRLINGSGFNISFCDFINIISFDENCLSIGVHDDTTDTRISHCKFDGYDGGDGFLIAGIASSETTRQIYLEDCVFSKCRTSRTTGKIIKEYGVYESGLLGTSFLRKKNEIKLVTTRNCRGLDKVNTEGSKVEDAKLKTTTETGALIGAALAAGMFPLPVSIAAGAYLAVKELRKDDALHLE